MADSIDGISVHLAQRDVTLLAVSRAPLPEIERFRQRMGWQFKWVSSYGTEFNYDFGVSFTPEQRAKGDVYYNYVMQPFRPEEAPASACSIRTRRAKSFTPTRPMVAE